MERNESAVTAPASLREACILRLPLVWDDCCLSTALQK